MRRPPRVAFRSVSRWKSTTSGSARRGSREQGYGLYRVRVHLAINERRRDVLDALLGAVLLAASLADLFTHALQGMYPHSVSAHVPFLVVMSLFVFVRRRHSLVALIGLGIVESAWLYTLYPMDQQPPLIPFVQLVVVVYSAAAYADGRAARAAWIVVVLGIATDIPSLAIGKPVGNVAGPDVLLALAFALGLGFGRIRRRAAEQEQRATAAEAEQYRAVERAAADERARIARELHDVVSHDVSMMVLQASVERRLAGDTAGEALASIEATGREALTELRRMLGVLRKDDQHPELAPQPALAQLPELVERARAAGMPVHLIVDGDPVTVPVGLGIAAYRIVQESLTNAAKHAAGAPVSVTIRYGPHDLDIEVVDDGGPAVPVAGGGSGQGLIGMRERVTLFGGTLEATPGSGGGFAVHARLPLPT